MALIHHGTNPDGLLSSALESLNFSFKYGKLCGKTELTPQLQWLFTSSSLVQETNGDEGIIVVEWGNITKISYKIDSDEDGCHVRYSVIS